MPKLNDFLNKNSMSYVPGKLYKLNFSIGSEPVEVKEVEEKINFSEDVYYNQFKTYLDNFSLLELIRVSTLPPKQVLKRRINEVARYVNGSSKEKILENRYTINNYLNNYIFEQIMKLMNDPKTNTINLMQYLTLNLYMKDLGPLRNLQRYLVRAKKALKSSGFLSKQVQTDIKKYYSEVWNQFITGIEDKYFEESKKGLLSGASMENPPESKTTRLAAFSEDLTKIEIKEAKDEKEFCSTIEQILELSDAEKYFDTLEKYLKSNKEFIKSNLEKITKYIEENPLLDDYKVSEYFTKSIESFEFSSLKEYLDEANNVEVNNFSLPELFLGIENFTATGSSMILPKNYEKESDISGYLKPVRNIWYYFKGEELPNGKFELVIREFKYPDQDFKLLGLKDEDKERLYANEKYIVSRKTFDTKLDLMNEIIKESNTLQTQNYLQFSENDNKFNIIKDTETMILGSKLYSTYIIVFFAIKLENSFWQLYIYKVDDPKYVTGANKDFTSIISTVPDYSFKLSDKNEIKEFCNNYEILK